MFVLMIDGWLRLYRSLDSVVSNLSVLLCEAFMYCATENDGNWHSVYFSGCLCWGVSWTSWVTRFQVGMTGAEQRRYLRSDE